MYPITNKKTLDAEQGLIDCIKRIAIWCEAKDRDEFYSSASCMGEMQVIHIGTPLSLSTGSWIHDMSGLFVKQEWYRVSNSFRLFERKAVFIYKEAAIWKAIKSIKGDILCPRKNV